MMLSLPEPHPTRPNPLIRRLRRAPHPDQNLIVRNQGRPRHRSGQPERRHRWQLALGFTTLVAD